jgi:hypothetical protein
MKGTTNMKDIKESGSFVLAPEGTYEVEIAEIRDGESANGDPMITIKLVITSGEYQDSWVWDNILIPHLDSPAVKILGRTKHFLHCINEPYEGEEVEYDSDRWLWKKCKIRIAHEAPNEYHKRPKAVVAEYIVDIEEGIEEETPF